MSKNLYNNTHPVLPSLDVYLSIYYSTILFTFFFFPTISTNQITLAKNQIYANLKFWQLNIFRGKYGTKEQELVILKN